MIDKIFLITLKYFPTLLHAYLHYFGDFRKWPTELCKGDAIKRNHFIIYVVECSNT